MPFVLEDAISYKHVPFLETHKTHGSAQGRLLSGVILIVPAWENIYFIPQPTIFYAIVLRHDLGS